MELACTIWIAVMVFFGVCFAVIHLPRVIPDSWKLRYYVINMAYLMIATFLLSFYLLLLVFYSIKKSTSICTNILMKWATNVGLECEVRHVDNLYKTGKAVIVVNHQSFFDPIPFLAIWSSLSPTTLVYGGSELRNHMFLRKAVATQAHQFLDRRSNRTAMETLMISAGNHFKRGEQNKVLLFPEGKRNLEMKDFRFLEFKLGAFRLAKAYNVPVIPVVISPLYFIDHQRHYFTKGKIVMTALKAVYAEETGVDEFAIKVKCLMEEEFFKLKEELVDRKVP